MSTGEITAVSGGNGVVCPECGMTMYEVWALPPVHRVVQCMNRDCGLCGKGFEVKGPEVTLTPLVPVSSPEVT